LSVARYGWSLDAAAKPAARSAGTSVEAFEGEATAMPFPDAAFDSVGAFTMLHHVPTAAAQNRLFAEALRVLRPGGLFVGSDGVQSERVHGLHGGDVYNLVEPGTLLTFLQTLGFAHVTVIVDERMKFIARKPDPAEAVRESLR
jgi:SAM-dependent methyltransferase